MRAVPKPVSIEALDACHRQMQIHLAELGSLARHIEAAGLDSVAAQQAAAIEAFFSTTSRQHHADEERQVFPPLLAGGEAELVTAVRTLQQDHGWIEENWIQLAPQLRALASGNGWVDPAEFQHDVEVFLDLVGGHIALEETLIYPASKALWAQAVADRDMPAQR
ncbi:MAG: hemerythrin domain-containing protein [Pseudomonadota bacterium]|nr:hemerythrin domain-containing protein [Pseudomonadota bacterium]